MSERAWRPPSWDLTFREPVRPIRPLFIQCVECAWLKLDRRPNGWRAYIVDEGAIAVYCAVCADREFSEHG